MQRLCLGELTGTRYRGVDQGNRTLAACRLIPQIETLPTSPHRLPASVGSNGGTANYLQSRIPARATDSHHVQYTAGRGDATTNSFEVHCRPAISAPAKPSLSMDRGAMPNSLRRDPLTLAAKLAIGPLVAIRSRKHDRSLRSLALRPMPPAMARHRDSTLPQRVRPAYRQHARQPSDQC
ncbi:hypothetical protein EC9_09410 [Rosistilla ulvae]|uniref:Uncharacterized protein n=1 Tax=Rosistilla ulvae TaxID=1930277 RepID=A0A517LVX6_9BACT|nr:hypothetical protein EC9_09410 [Rosistilla ulvae]